MPALTMARRQVRELVEGIERWFFAPADPRAYVALRTAFGVTALSVLVDLWPIRLSLLGESGMFGAAPSRGLPFLDVFSVARSDAAVTAVFVLAAAAAVSLVLGFLPRVSAFVIYCWAASYTGAAPIAQSGFDTILRVVGFALVVGPKVETRRMWKMMPGAPPPPAYGLRLVQWQLMLIYICTAWLKAPDEFWRNGEAISYFWMSMFSRFPSPVFSHFGVLGAVLTYSTLLIEISLPFLLWMRRTRWLGVFLGCALHVGIAMTSKLALFSLAITSLYLAFFERGDFDRVTEWLGRRPASATAGAQSLPVRTTQ